MDTIIDLLSIKGLTVHSVKGSSNSKRVPVEYILFNDGQTYIELEEQDYYTYHDCSGSARLIKVIKNKDLWDVINTRYKDSTVDEISI